MAIKVGQIAPDFELFDETEVLHRLSDFRGKRVVLYFYPKDDTPGCTKEACNFRDDFSLYDQTGVVIVGLSPDKPKTHQKFKDKYQLPFMLLADPDHRVCLDYDVWGRKKYMGKEYDGVFRTTFIVDRDGAIEKVFENVKPDIHSAQVLEYLNR